MSVEGPWGSRDGSKSAPEPAREATRYSARHEAPSQEDKGQHPVWAVVSTLLMAGFLWFLTGSWVVAGAVLFGLFVHEYGHVLAMNRVGMGPARIYIIPSWAGWRRASGSRRASGTECWCRWRGRRSACWP
jgi:hypothetical protein